MDSAAGDGIPAGGAAAASEPDGNEAAAAPPTEKTWQRKMPKKKAKIGRFKGSGAKSKKQKHPPPPPPDPGAASITVAAARTSQAASRKKTNNALTNMLGQAQKAQVAAQKQCEKERLEKEKQKKGRAKEKEKVIQLGDRLASSRRQRRGLAQELKAAAVQYNKLDKEATVSHLCKYYFPTYEPISSHTCLTSLRLHCRQLFKRWQQIRMQSVMQKQKSWLQGIVGKYIASIQNILKIRSTCNTSMPMN